jgi:hypothetical protein
MFANKKDRTVKPSKCERKAGELMCARRFAPLRIVEPWSLISFSALRLDTREADMHKRVIAPVTETL